MGRFFHLLTILLVAGAFLAVYPLNALSQDRSGGPQSSATLTILGKAPDSISAVEWQCEVTEETVIIDVEGEEITLADLPVPCTAKIEYQLRMDQDPVAKSITIQRISKGATKAWSSP